MAIEQEPEQQPLVTFIVTNYNLPVAFVKECLDSILAVSFDDTEREIILVDDGSRDPIRPSLSEYKSSVRFFRQTNQGLSAARNLGIEHAQGQYIQFVDGDDMLIPDAYDEVVAEMRQNRADVILFKLTDKVKDKPDTPTVIVHQDIQHWAMSHNLRASACGYMFRRELLSDGLRFISGIYHEDEAFTPLLFEQSTSICDIDLSAYYYRIREGSITNKPTREHIEKRFSDLLSVIKMLREKANENDSYLLTRRYRQLTMDFLYKVMSLSGNPSDTEHYVEQLRKEQLFPLHITNAYTHKYWLFAQLTRFRSVRKAMSIKYKRK